MENGSERRVGVRCIGWLDGWRRLLPRGIIIIQFQTRQLRKRLAEPKALPTVGIGLGECPHDVFVAKAMVTAQLPNGLCETAAGSVPQRHRFVRAGDAAGSRSDHSEAAP